MYARGMLLLFHLPLFGKSKAAHVEGSEQATQDVVEAAKILRGQADDVIRAAYALADERQRKIKEATKREP